MRLIQLNLFVVLWHSYYEGRAQLKKTNHIKYLRFTFGYCSVCAHNRRSRITRLNWIDLFCFDSYTNFYKVCISEPRIRAYSEIWRTCGKFCSRHKFANCAPGAKFCPGIRKQEKKIASCILQKGFFKYN